MSIITPMLLILFVQSMGDPATMTTTASFKDFNRRIDLKSADSDLSVLNCVRVNCEEASRKIPRRYS